MPPKGKPNKRYTPEFKIKVVETMHKENLSYSETARQFDVSDHNRVYYSVTSAVRIFTKKSFCKVLRAKDSSTAKSYWQNGLKAPKTAVLFLLKNVQ